MNLKTARLPQPPRGSLELSILMLVVWLALVSVPLALGGIGLSWDALNHQVYLGWIADRPRFDRDFWAASSQSYQFPYLYWPFFKLIQSGFSGLWAGVILASIHLLLAPALWMIARALIPDGGWYGFLMRSAAVVLAFLSVVVLSHLDSTSNDLMASIPMVWAVALGLRALSAKERQLPSTTHLVVLSGAAAGVAVAFKLSNGPLAVVLPVLWFAIGGNAGQRLRAVAYGSAATLASFGVVYGHWGWMLWQEFGNPVYPFYDWLFQPFRSSLGEAK